MLVYIRIVLSSLQKIVSGTFWTLVTNIINALYGFISVPILIAYFGKSNYGLIGIAMSVNVYLNLMDLGFNATNIRFFSEWLSKKDSGKVSKLFQTCLSFYGIIGVINSIILLITSYFSDNLFNLTHEECIILSKLLNILAISAFFQWFTSCFDQLIKATENVGWVQRRALIPKLWYCIVLCLTVWLKLSIELFYFLSVFSFVLILPITVKKIKKLCSYISFKPIFDKSIFLQILPYSLNIFAFSIFQFSITYLRPIFLGIRGTVESVADYRILNAIVGLVTLIGGSFLGILLPSAAKAIAVGNTQATNKLIYQGTKFISFVLCFCCFGFMSIGEDTLCLYVGEEYCYLIPWLNIWLITTLGGHNQAISSLILSQRNINVITRMTVISCSFGLALAWFLIPIYGLGGTVIAFAIYQLGQLLFFYLYYWPKVMNINSTKVFTNSFFPYIICGIISVVVSHYFIFSSFNSHILSLLIKGVVFTISFMLLSLLFLSQDDKLYIKKFIHK